MDGIVIQIFFCLLIIVYWFSEGVTEGWTWSTKKRKETNKLIHPNNKSNGIFDYHMWRILENVGIYGVPLYWHFLWKVLLRSSFG